MRLKNAVWMLWLLLRKKWLWLLAMIFALYGVVIPYQRNLLRSFENPQEAEVLFWNRAYLFHSVFALVFLFQAAMQLLNMEAWELHRMWRKQMCMISGAVFAAYQILAIPAYVWYLRVYPGAGGNLCGLVLAEFGAGCIFYAASMVGRKTMAGFLVVFIGILLLFGR